MNTIFPQEIKVKCDTIQIHELEQDDLWERFRSGEDAAFEMIYHQYVNMLFNLGCQLTSDEEILKDCLQDFFIYLRQRRGSLGTVKS